MSEHTEQSALFAFAAQIEARVPELRLLFAIPNGEKRDKATGARLKRAGVRAGVPDICLPIASQGFHGYYLELKIGRNKTSAAQQAWLDALSDEGYAVDVSYGWQQAAIKILCYLGLDPKDFSL